MQKIINLIKGIIYSLVVGSVIFVMTSCAALPWCKNVDTWTERIATARQAVVEAHQAADALYASGAVTAEQYAEMLKACDICDDSLQAAQAALSLCIRRIGAPDRAEATVAQAEADAATAYHLANTYRQLAPKAGAKVAPPVPVEIKEIK